MKILPVRFLAYTFLLLICTSLGRAEDPPLLLEDLTVRPAPGSSRLCDASVSARLIEASELATRDADHLQQVMALVPNLTWAGGTSRPRYLQLRGVGERSHFAGEGPPNFSVGFLVDDMDFSGMGMHASLFDAGVVEVLRGPQAAIYGSKAMAGLVNIRSLDPTPAFEGKTGFSIGTDDHYSAGLTLAGPISPRNPDHLQFRLTAHGLSENGFRNNRFLGKDDTNQRDERTLRLKLRGQPADDLQVDLALLYADYDNGYDGWAADNNGFDTYTDQPGRDAQLGRGASLRVSWDRPASWRLLGISSLSLIDSCYSYDADWGNAPYWAAAPYFFDPRVEGYDYSFFEITEREHRRMSQEIRLQSKPGGEILGGRSSWTVGAHAARMDEDDDYRGFSQLISAYQADTAALYGQLSTRLSDRITLHSDLRIERRETDYRDDTFAYDDSEDMIGGRLALEAKLSQQTLVYASVSRGFKGGGGNPSPALPEDKRHYDSEYLWNFETGLRASDLLDGKLDTALTAFYMLREDLQINTSLQADPNDPTAFTYYTDNAARGFNYGLEAQAQLELGAGLEYFASLGLLQTEFEDFESAGGQLDVTGREQPYAPNYNYLTGLRYQHEGGAFARIEVEGKDAFYYSDSHDQQSAPYELLHGALGYAGDTWTLTLWGRNMLDREYNTRGFFFGLEPPAYEERLFVTRGDPAQFGITVERAF